MTRTPKNKIHQSLLLVLSLLILFTQTVAANQPSVITREQISLLTLRGKSLKQTREFLAALRQVESSGNDKAVGDNGNAIGAYQIWRDYWQDAVEFDKTIGGKYADCFNRQYSERVVVAYLNKYAPEGASWETFARIHNGGPKGYKIKATEEYWQKVKRELQKQK